MFQSTSSFQSDFLRKTACVLVGLLAIAGTAAQPFDTKRLADIAARYGVPLPPTNSQLVLAKLCQDRNVYSPAFLLEENADGGILVLRGFVRESIERQERGDLSWRPFSPQAVDPRIVGYSVDFKRRSAFICAVQLALRGEKTTAENIWKQVSTAEQWSDGSYGRVIPEDRQNPCLLLGRCLLNRCRLDLLRRGANWRLLNRRSKALVKEFPALFAEARMAVIGDLLETLNAKLPPRQSVEAHLIDWARQPHERLTDSIFDLDPACHDVNSDAPAREIVLRGFDSIPGLLALIDDTRLTAHLNPYGRNDVAAILRLRDLAHLLLVAIGGLDDPPHDAEFTWQKWWRMARTKTEADFFVERIFRRDNQKITWINEVPARILARKYPQRLAALFATFVMDATPDAQSFALAEALVASSLPREIKVRVLVKSAQAGSLQNRRCIFQVLSELDAAQCVKLIRPILRNLPVDSSGAYWICPEAAFSHVVMELDDPDVWRLLLRAAKRSVAALRMEMIEPMNYAYIGDKNRGYRLAIIAAFLDDPTIRTIPHGNLGARGKYDGPCAAFTFPTIEVRNFAAMQAACLLRLKHSPSPNWSAGQWRSFREKVRAKLAYEELPSIEASGAP
jgi:hypothetical protein